MNNPMTPAHRFAIGGSAILWACDSTYLVNRALKQPEADTIDTALVPILWVVVIALPILAHHARAATS